MCNRNKVLDTINCQYIDTTKSRSPYFQGRLLRTIFTFNQTGITTSSTLVDLTCRNTWCVTDWQRRPKSSILKIKSLGYFNEQNFAKNEQQGFIQSYASTSSVIGSTYDALNITHRPYNFNQNTVPFYNSGLHPFEENRHHLDYPQARRLSSCRFETRNESKSNFGCTEPSFMPALNGYPTFNIVRPLHPQCIGSVCNKNTSYYNPYQQNSFSNPIHYATTWNCVRHKSSSNMFEIQDMHVPIYRLSEFSPNSVFESRMLLPKSATSNVKYKTSELPSDCTNGQQKGEVMPGLNLDINVSVANKETGEQKLECPQCNFKCSNRGQLTGHIRVHTGEKPYTCTATSCGKSFARNEELTRHLRIHSGYRPYICCQCSKRFSRKDHLNKHARTHLQSYEKRTYICRLAECGQRYTRSDALARHQMASHGIKPKSSKS